MALFGGVNVNRSPGTALGRESINDAIRANFRTSPIPTFQGSLAPGFTPFQQRAFDIAGSAGTDPTLSAAQGFLPSLASGGLVGSGPGAATLASAARGGFSFLPEAQSALDFSRGISGIPAGLAATAAGENLASPFISGEFTRQAEPLIRSFRDIQFPGLQGAIGASGLTGTRRQEFLEEDLQDRANRALSGVAADLIGRERGLQQQAQLSIPGILQSQLGGQLGAIGQLGSLAGQQVGFASTADAALARDRALASQVGLAAPGFATGALGAQINPLLQLGGLQQQQQRLEALDEQRRLTDPAIQREAAIANEVQRAALLAGRAPAFQGNQPNLQQSPSALGEGLAAGLSLGQLASLFFGGGSDGG